MNDTEIAQILALEAERRRDEGPAARSLREADTKVHEALMRALAARTSAHPMGIGREIDWIEFKAAMRDLTQAAEERHAAKHYAVHEAHLDTGPVTVYRSAPSRGEGP